MDKDALWQKNLTKMVESTIPGLLCDPNIVPAERRRQSERAIFRPQAACVK